MSEVVVVGSFTAKRGKEREALEASRAVVAPTHSETGCILYALHQGADDPRRLAFVERWGSREELDAHLTSPHVRDFLVRVDELFSDGGVIVVYDAIPEGEHNKGSLAAHAGSAG